MNQEQKERILRVKNSLRVTKVVCTRAIKGSRGDNFVGWSAAWDSVQDDQGQDLDLMEGGLPTQAMSLKDAQIASCLLGMQVDIAAHRNAKADGNMSVAQADSMIDGIKTNYARLMADILGENGNGDKS